jgi:two-component system, chemotaxis family, sensor kinase CheA
VAPAAKRVLLVDDSITTRTLERSILEAAGYEVLTAADGAAAWTLLGEQTVDLVVTDVDMPYMNGFALVEAVRASATLRELPVILVTARNDEGDRQRGLEIGADAYIVKSSFRQEELLDAIGSLT